jgi:hypothetical protein
MMGCRLSHEIYREVMRKVHITCDRAFGSEESCVGTAVLVVIRVIDAMGFGQLESDGCATTQFWPRTSYSEVGFKAAVLLIAAFTGGVRYS